MTTSAVERLLAVAAVAAAGCLPEGGPGIGEHILAGRGIAGVRVLERTPAARDPLVLFMKTQHQATNSLEPGANETFELLRELFVLPGAGGEPRRLLGEVPAYPDPYEVADAQGRLLVQHRPDATRAGSWELTRVDPAAEAPPVSLGRVRRLLQAPEATWIAYQRLDGSLAVRGDDEVERSVAAGASQLGFAGEVLVFSETNELKAMSAPEETPRTLARAVSSWTTVKVEGRPHLVINGQGADGQRELLLLDATSDPRGPPRLLARGRFLERPYVSPDGERLAVLDSLAPEPMVRVRVIRLGDLQVVQTATIPVPPPDPGPADGLGRPGALRANVEFRPGTMEVWCFLNRKLTIVGADGMVVAVGNERQESPVPIVQARAYGQARRRDRFVAERPETASAFTADGHRWVFGGPGGAVLLGDAGDPTGASGEVPVRLGRDREVEAIFELTPGGALAVLRDLQGGRDDLHLLDVGARELRPVIRDVSFFTAGDGRALALVRKIGGRFRGTGDLVLVDLISGAETILARNVGEAVLSPPPCDACDPIAPGTPLTYVVQARIPWRHDGLWMGALP